jgi:D-3-phosphoglycerate dehydrogenase
MKIIRTDRELEAPHIDTTLRAAGHELILLPDGIAEDDLIAQVRDTDLLLMCYTPITARVIAAASRLKGIVKYGVGIDAIDIPAARSRGIAVVNIPEYAEETVAEGAPAPQLALARTLLPPHRRMQSDGWAWPEARGLASDIAGKPVGLVGAGKIGRSMARMAGAGFRAQVLGYDPHVSTKQMQAAGIEKHTDLHAMLAASDFVSVHCVLSPETRHLIGRAELAAMKPTALLVNVSRGAIIDEDALLAALENATIAGAGLDVFSREPLTRTGHPLSRLFEMPNVLLTPHLTFYTAEAMRRLEDETLERCFEILEGRKVLVKSEDPRLR